MCSSYRKVIFEKQWFLLDNAVGQLYSTTFEIVSGVLQLKTLTNTGNSAGVFTAAHCKLKSLSVAPLTLL